MLPPSFDALMDALDALPPGDAVFDLDGTLIAGDIGETALKLVAGRGPLPPVARSVLGEGSVEAIFHRYEALDPVAQCVVAVQALAGLTEAEVLALVDHAFGEGHVSPRPEICALAHAVARRHRVWLLTGSAEILGVGCARRLGLLPAGVNAHPGAPGARSGVIGVRAVMEQGRGTEQILEPVSCAEGKVATCELHFRDRPVFAIGDSPWDRFVLAHAHVGRTTGRISGQGFPAFP
jgi:phosphoserine phosphatase